MLGDWQTIISDPCTDNSLFHHPELLQQYILRLATPTVPEIAFVAENVPCEKLNLSENMLKYLANTDIYVLPESKVVDMTARCLLVPSCPLFSQQDSKFESFCSTYLHIRLSVDSCLYSPNAQLNLSKIHQRTFIYSSSMHKFQLNICVHVSLVSPSTAIQYTTVQKYMAHVHVQTVQVLESRLAVLAEDLCEGQFHHSCHWNPHSTVTGRYCEDCPPICRDKKKYLHFFQFVIGLTLLFVTFEMIRIPTVCMVSDLVQNNHLVRLTFCFT